MNTKIRSWPSILLAGMMSMWTLHAAPVMGGVPLTEKEVNAQLKGAIKTQLTALKTEVKALQVDLAAALSALDSSHGGMTIDEYVFARNKLIADFNAAIRALRAKYQYQLLQGGNPSANTLFLNNQATMSSTKNFNFEQGEMAKFYGSLKKEVEKGLKTSAKYGEKSSAIQKSMGLSQQGYQFPLEDMPPVTESVSVPGDAVITGTSDLDIDGYWSAIGSTYSVSLTVGGPCDPLDGQVAVTLTSDSGVHTTVVTNTVGGLWQANFTPPFYGNYQVDFAQGPVTGCVGVGAPDPERITCPWTKSEIARLLSILKGYTNSANKAFNADVFTATQGFGASASNLFSDYNQGLQSITNTASALVRNEAEFEAGLYDAGNEAAVSVERGFTSDPETPFMQGTKDFDPFGKGFLGKWHDKLWGKVNKAWPKVNKLNQKLVKAAQKKGQRLVVRNNPPKPQQQRRATPVKNGQRVPMVPIPLRVAGVAAYAAGEGPGNVHCWGRGELSRGTVLVRAFPIGPDNAFQGPGDVFTATTMAGVPNTWECIIPGVPPTYMAIRAEQQWGARWVRSRPFLVDMPGPGIAP